MQNSENPKLDIDYAKYISMQIKTGEDVGISIENHNNADKISVNKQKKSSSSFMGSSSTIANENEFNPGKIASMFVQDLNELREDPLFIGSKDQLENLRNSLALDIESSKSIQKQEQATKN